MQKKVPGKMCLLEKTSSADVLWKQSSSIPEEDAAVLLRYVRKCCRNRKSASSTIAFPGEILS